MKFLFTFMLVSLMFVFNASAQQILLRADRLLDVTSGKIISQASILVSENIIISINPSSIPENTKIIDLGNVTLMPGMIDNHVHLTAGSPAFHSDIVKDNASTLALKGAKYANDTLLAGFTAVRDVAQISYSKELVTVSLAMASEQGLIDAPRIIAVGKALSMTGGHIDPAMFANTAEGVLDLSWQHGVADGVNDVLKATRYQIKHGAKAIKLTATAGVVSFEPSVGAQQYTYEEMKTIVDEASRHDIKVAAHAHGTEGIKAAIRAGVASIEHGSMLDDEAIQMMKANGTYLVPTIGLIDTIGVDKLPKPLRDKANYVIPLAKASISKAIASGVKIALGSDAPLIAHGQNAKEAAALVLSGMSNIGAIQAATINGAELIGIKGIGEIKVGYFADIIAVSGDPVADITVLSKVTFVMKNGKVYRYD
jgi:imidazolonepropionase-like amidohydrolase